MLEVGCTVTHEKLGSTRFVVHWIRPDGLINLVAPITDGSGNTAFQGHIATPGDLTVVEPAPIYSPGAVIVRGGVQLTVLQDNGDTVEFSVGESRKPLRGSGNVLFPAGNTTVIGKSDLVLEGY